MTAPAATRIWAPDPHGSAHPSLHPHHALGLQVADYCHVAGDNREGYLVGPPPPELVPLLVPCGIAEDPHQRPSLTMVAGPATDPRWRISKCRWGAVDRPLLPLSPITSPGATVALAVTKMRERWPYIVWYSSGMVEQYEESVFGVLSGLSYGGTAGGSHQAPDRDGDVDPWVGLIATPCLDLSPGDVTGFIQWPVLRDAETGAQGRGAEASRARIGGATGRDDAIVSRSRTISPPIIWRT